MFAKSDESTTNELWNKNYRTAKYPRALNMMEINCVMKGKKFKNARLTYYVKILNQKSNF
jgi:hypothetical protein